MKQNHEQNHRYCVYLGLLEECSCLGLFRAERSLSLSPFVPAVGSKKIFPQKSNLAKRRRGRAATVFKNQTSAKGAGYWAGQGWTVFAVIIEHRYPGIPVSLPPPKKT